MRFVALRMLLGDGAKYIAIVFGLTFTALLVTQQLSIFVGLMERSYSAITDIRGGDVWIMDPLVQQIDDKKPLADTVPFRLRSVPGIEYALPLFRVFAVARLQGGYQQTVALVGLDDTTLAGAPAEVVKGTLADLRRPDAVIVDADGLRDKFNGAGVGDILELNDHRAEIVAICKVKRTFTAFPVIYTTYSRAKQFAPSERRNLTYVVAKLKPGADLAAVKAEVARRTGLVCLTNDEFARRTWTYIMKNTGIPVNFGITVLLGFIVGTAIAGQTFYTFTLENLKQFGALKAMGASDWTLVRMVVLQAMVVAALGYGIGVGGAALFGWATAGTTLAFHLRWEILAFTAAAILFVAVGSSFLSLWKLVRLDPAIVFRG
ncbi:MAG TPA: ABC transporter permease [Planctomycetota bacterium]|nr:ABC transporter permease [Planctomycetota bacterium]